VPVEEMDQAWSSCSKSPFITTFVVQLDRMTKGRYKICDWIAAFGEMWIITIVMVSNNHVKIFNDKTLAFPFMFSALIYFVITKATGGGKVFSFGDGISEFPST